MGKKRKIEFAWLPRIPTSSRPPKSSPPSRTVTSKPWEEFPKTNTHPDKNEAYRAYIEARDRERETERQRDRWPDCIDGKQRQDQPSQSQQRLPFSSSSSDLHWHGQLEHQLCSETHFHIGKTSTVWSLGVSVWRSNNQTTSFLCFFFSG